MVTAGVGVATGFGIVAGVAVGVVFCGDRRGVMIAGVDVGVAIGGLGLVLFCYECWIEKPNAFAVVGEGVPWGGGEVR